MATQHPDNAQAPFFQSRPFISTRQEIKECYLTFSSLGIDEYNWDWEGKFVDEAVVDRFLHQHYRYFQKHPLGKDKFLTFRIPNPRVEKQFRLARAFMVAITSSCLSQSLGFDNPPIFEAILPLTESAQEVLEIQKAFSDLINVKHKLLSIGNSLKYLEIIPLFEQVEKIINSGSLIRNYIKLHLKTFGFAPTYIRPYCARSDPALNSGLIPTVLAVKMALSSYRDLSEEFGVSLFPMLGTGSLPFRGGLSPETYNRVIDEYAGVSTYTIQSAFRYDYKPSVVKKAVEIMKKKVSPKKALKLDSKQIKVIKNALPLFTHPYRQTVEKLAPLINSISKSVPNRRERMLHIGLFGYCRGVGRVQLPRAIPFTASLYSLGIPPELIGTGRGIKKASNCGLWLTISPLYIYLKEELQQAGYFLNKENVKSLAKRYSYFEDIADDIKYIEKYLGVKLGPTKPVHDKHLQLTKKVYDNLNNRRILPQLITKSGILRKSLG